jgi:hypothetical protein
MHSSGIFRPLHIAITVLLLLLPLTTPSAQQPNSPKSFSKNEIIRLLKGDVPGNRVAALARERGIEFQMNQENEAEIRQAGADDSLVATLRALAPEPVAPLPASPPILAINSTPGGARIYIDDEPVGTTSPEGRFKVSTLTPGKHHLRLALDGYLDREQDVELTLGHLTNADFPLDLRPTATTAPPALPAPAVAQKKPRQALLASPMPQENGIATFEHFGYFHGFLSNAHDGRATVSAEGIQWTEYEDKSHPTASAHLLLACSEIRTIKTEKDGYGSVQIKGRSKNYSFVPGPLDVELYTPSKWSIKKDAIQLWKQRQTEFLDALLSACPSLRTPDRNL